jgi:arabinogalactan oligomer / maltooligosaccharide transport system substrate-binding protein
MNSRTRIVALLVVAFVGLFAAVAGSVHAATKAGNTLVIWTDVNRYNAVKSIAATYEKANPGVTVNVVQKQFGESGAGTIGGDLTTASVANAPDIINAANDWTGQFAANGLVVPIYLSKAQQKEFPSYTLNGFSYGVAIKHLYGLPVQIENIGLVVNTSEAKVPKTWSQLRSEALAWKHKHHTKVGIAVQQGSGGDAYHMYPFFSGLGGYIFGTNKAGNLDPSNIGVANKTFLKSSKLIDQWNKEGLINSAVDSSTAQSLFTSKKVPFWVTGPWNSQLLSSSGIKFTVVQIPKIVKPAVPFLGIQGFMVTKYASQHGVSALAQDFVANYLTKPANQLALARAGGRYPANIQAGKEDHDKVLAEFGRASKGGVPMPNIPQMGSVWTYLGNAWVVSTKGKGATSAAKAFRSAAHSIAEKIG